jgi:hypothetical protein
MSASEVFAAGFLLGLTFVVLGRVVKMVRKGFGVVEMD